MYTVSATKGNHLPIRHWSTMGVLMLVVSVALHQIEGRTMGVLILVSVALHHNAGRTMGVLN